MRIERLSAYSPDFNPIEEGFSVTKAWIRANREYVLAELTGRRIGNPYTMLFEAVIASMMQENAQGWFKDCGYT